VLEGELVALRPLEEADAVRLREIVETPEVAGRPRCGQPRAVRSYEKAGFEPVGVMRSSWREPAGVWRDSLLMERIAL
jgi:L-amino acid N-acyltransferase YncA